MRFKTEVTKSLLKNSPASLRSSKTIAISKEPASCALTRTLTFVISPLTT
nr:MAG TPA: hypothetical protein [Caudoviricetes sp.]